MLFNDCLGRRVIRICNMALKVHGSCTEVMKHADEIALSTWLTRTCNPIHLGVKEAREKLCSTIVNILHNYKCNISDNTNPQFLVMPESLRTLCLNMLSFLKSAVMTHRSINADSRIAWQNRILNAPYQEISNML